MRSGRCRCFVSWLLTWVVDGVQVDPFGADKKPDPLQLAVSDVVLENDVVGEVDVADGLQGRRGLAFDWDATVLIVSLDPHGLGHGKLVVLHPAQSSCWVLADKNSWIPGMWLFKKNQIVQVFFEVYVRSVFFFSAGWSGSSSLGVALLLFRLVYQQWRLSLWRPGLPQWILYTLLQAILRDDTSRISVARFGRWVDL